MSQKQIGGVRNKKELLDKKTNGLKTELDLLTERILYIEATAMKAVSEGQIKKRLRAFISDLESVEFSKRKKVVAALVKCIYIYLRTEWSLSLKLTQTPVIVLVEASLS